MSSLTFSALYKPWRVKRSSEPLDLKMYQIRLHRKEETVMMKLERLSQVKDLHKIERSCACFMFFFILSGPFSHLS